MLAGINKPVLNEAMPSQQETLIFIPDISGFTNFVNTTEISHSRHIISELMEIIINSDISDMMVSEIEGDAVLFFRDHSLSLESLIQQCEITYRNFHQHIIKYDTERICRCGACENAAGLSLKFIIHAGPVEIISIKDHRKLHGTDVIKAHKLLKNSIEENEYILISNTIKRDVDLSWDDNHKWVSFKAGIDHYEGLDSIEYEYIPLREVPIGKSSSSITFPQLSSQRITLESKINAPVDVIYDYYTDFNKRVEWNEEIREIILKNGNLNKSGSIHACLIGNNSLDIESIGRLEDEDRIIYGERLNKFRGLRDIINIFTFEKQGDVTILKVEIDYKIKSFLGKIMKPVVNSMLRKQTEKAMQKLKNVSEKNL